MIHTHGNRALHFPAEYSRRIVETGIMKTQLCWPWMLNQKIFYLQGSQLNLWPDQICALAMLIIMIISYHYYLCNFDVLKPKNLFGQLTHCRSLLLNCCISESNLKSSLCLVHSRHSINVLLLLLLATRAVK